MWVQTCLLVRLTLGVEVLDVDGDGLLQKAVLLQVAIRVRDLPEELVDGLVVVNHHLEMQRAVERRLRDGVGALQQLTGISESTIQDREISALLVFESALQKYQISTNAQFRKASQKCC